MQVTSISHIEMGFVNNKRSTQRVNHKITSPTNELPHKSGVNVITKKENSKTILAHTLYINVSKEQISNLSFRAAMVIRICSSNNHLITLCLGMTCALFSFNKKLI